MMKPNRDLSNWVGRNTHIDAMNKAIIAVRVRGLEDVITQLKQTNAALLDVVRDCVNFLADLNSTSPFDAEYMEQRAKALHKRAYTAHSKAKES